MIDFIFFANFPETAGMRVSGNALEHEGSGPGQQGAVNDIGVASDPADIGGAPIDVTLLVLEDIEERKAGVNHISPTGVHHPFGFSGRTGSVKDEKHVFGIHRFSRALGGLGVNELMPPGVAPLGEFNFSAGIFMDDNCFDTVAA